MHQQLRDPSQADRMVAPDDFEADAGRGQRGGSEAGAEHCPDEASKAAHQPESHRSTVALEANADPDHRAHRQRQQARPVGCEHRQ